MKQSDLPWNIPVPVKKSFFKSLNPADQHCNVEVDLASITAFSSSRKKISNQKLLFSDLQINADGSYDKRLGSGRAGFYQNKYLKGIGRTLLAGNWNSGTDLYHSSGSMLASGAIREFLVSMYLRKLNKQNLIAECSGILVKKLNTKDFNAPRRIFKGNIFLHNLKYFRFSHADRHLQAITVKPANFSRFSNFVWLLCNFPQYFEPDPRARPTYFFEIFYQALNCYKPTTLHLTTTEDIVNKLAESINAGLKSIMEAWTVGVHWGSFHNNFTLDGRFLDLETPSILPFPVIGLKVNEIGKKIPVGKKIYRADYRDLDCLDAIRYISQVKIFISFLRSRLQFFIDSGFCQPIEIRFIRDFFDCLNTKFSKSHFLYSKEEQLEKIISNIATHTGLSTSNKKLRLICASGLKLNKKTKKMPFYKIDVGPIANPEPSVKYSLYVPDFVADLKPNRNSQALQINDHILQAESYSDPEKLLEFLFSLEIRK